MIRRRHSDRGSAIALVLVLIVLIAGMGVALATVTSAHNRSSASFHLTLEATYVAEGALEQAKYAISMSMYDLNGNVWLNTYANPEDGDNIYPSPGDRAVPPTALDPALPTGQPLKIGRGTAELYAYSEDTRGEMYRLVVRAVVAERTVTVAQDLRARDTFARYATYVASGALNFLSSSTSPTTVAGDIHSNGDIFFWGDGSGARFNFLDKVSTAGRFRFRNGANSGNTSFRSSQQFAPSVNMPPIRSIDLLRASTTGAYDLHQTNPLYTSANPINADIQLMGSMVQITAKDSVTGAVLNPGAPAVPLPADGVIYVQGSVTSIKGTSSGQVTVATPGSIDVTGRLTYVDSSGNPAYLLMKNGAPVPGNDTPPGVVWDSSYSYVPNPAYSPSAGTPAVGLMAGWDVEITPAADYNMELHAAVLSATSNWYANSSPGNVKGNFRFVGSLSSNNPGYRSQGTDGWSLSGGYVYDANLLRNPPPRWLMVEQSFWGPRRQVAIS